MAVVDIYVRVSRVGGREHLISPDEQERQARELAGQNGLTVGEVYRDIDHSGGTLERPGLQKALARIRKGKSRGIVVAYLSRLTRDVAQGLAIIEEVRSAGGDVYAPNLSDYTSADGRMLNTIQLAIDAGLRERAREGFARSRQAAIERGIPVSRPPVGYRVRADRRFEPDPSTAPVVRAIFELRAAGAGPAELAEYLQAHRVKTSQGSKTWSRPAVASLLRSRTYLGEISSGEFVNANGHDPIVDEALWQAAQRPRPKPKASRAKAGPYPLSGILRCASCGYSMQGTVSSHGHRWYRCIGRHAGGRCPASARTRAEVVESAVELAFRRIVDDVVANEVKDDATAALVAALEGAESRLEAAKAPSVQDALGDRWPDLLRDRRDDVEKAREALAEARQATFAVRLPDSMTLRNLWPELGPQDRRELYAAAFDAVALGRDRRVAFFPSGSFGEPLSRRGFKRSPELRPIIFDDLPARAFIETLEDRKKRSADSPRRRLVKVA